MERSDELEELYVDCWRELYGMDELDVIAKRLIPRWNGKLADREVATHLTMICVKDFCSNPFTFISVGVISEAFDHRA